VVDVFRIFPLQQGRDFLGQSDTTSLEELVDGSVGIADDLRRPCLVLLFLFAPTLSALLLHALERMAEWAMPHVMEERCKHRGLGTFFNERLANLRDSSLDDIDQLTRRVEHANRVGEAGMGRTRKDELGYAKLPDAPHALNLRRVQQPPGELIQLAVFSEHDQAVNRVSNSLISTFLHNQNI